ncbi:MAG: FAD-dependent oxidoreductase, partial [Deltaproteobacteria bacterium]
MHGKVFIVGGGLAGLSAAWKLQREGIETEVFEAGEGIGGRAGNRTPAPGFTIDTGAEFFGSFYRTTRSLLRDLGLEGEIVPLRAAGMVWRAGFAHPFPGSPAAFLSTPLLSWRTKRNLLRIALRLWRTDLSWDTPATAAPFDTESAHAFVTREIGE